MQQRMSAEPGDYPDDPQPVRKGALVIDLGKRRGAVGKKLKGAGAGGETVASWNAANPTHPRGADGRFRDAFNSALSIRGDSIEAEAGRRKGVAEALRGLVAEHGGAKTKLGKALLEMVGPGESVSTPDLGGKTPSMESAMDRDAATKLRHAEAMFGSDRSKWTAAQRAQAAKLEGAGGHAVATSTGKPAKASESLNPYEAKRPRVKLGVDEKFKQLDELNAKKQPTADDEAEFDKVLSTMTVAEMKHWLAGNGRSVHNPGKKDAFRRAIVQSMIGSKRDQNTILHGKWNSDMGPTDEQLRGAETAARLRSALASIQDGGLTEANEADFRKHLTEMTPAELDVFRKDHDIPGAGGLQIRANAIKIFIEGRKRTASVMRVEELADRQLTTERFPGDKWGGNAKFMADLEQARKDYPEIGRYVESPAALKRLVAEKQAEGIAQQLSGATPADRKQILGMVADSRLEAVAHAAGVPVRKEWSGQVLRDHIARHLEAFGASNVTETRGAAKGSKRVPPDDVLNGMSVKALRDLYKELVGIESKPSAQRLKRDVIAAIKHDVGQGDWLKREGEKWNATVAEVDAESVRRAAADDADFAKFQAERAGASLKEATSVEAGKKYLQGLGLSKAQAHQLAKDLDVPVAANASIDSVLNSIVDIKVKWRMDSRAIEGTNGPKMSLNPRKANTWGGMQEQGSHTFHPDGVIGGLIGGGRPGDWATIPADQRKLEVRGDSLENVLGDLATETMAGRMSPKQQLEQMAQIASELPKGPAKDALRRAVDMLDVPKVDISAKLTDGGGEAYGRFPALRELVRTLNEIPLARGAQIPGDRGDTRELDKITDALNAFAEGKLGGQRFISAIEAAHNIRHESREGKAAIDRAINRALDALQAQFKENRTAFYPDQSA